jgi:glycosyltransferase involved in cell wall biosynthesis
MPARESSNAAPSQQWIALLGCRNEPADGVEDYCTFLGRALAPRGVTLEQVRVKWDKQGWLGALRQLQRDSASWRGKRVILQYTALAWSRRGFPLGALKTLAVLRRSGAHCAIMFHEPFRQGDGLRVIDRLRGAVQDWVIRRLYARANKAVFPDPLNQITWLPRNSAKAYFVPIGANIPDPPAPHPALLPDTPQRTVSVFCVSDPPYRQREVEDIAHAVRTAVGRELKLRLVLIGKGTLEARDLLDRALQGASVDVELLGLRTAEEVSRTLAASDAMLCVRGKLYPRRGSALAGIACGLPLVGYAGESEGTPLEEAGVALVPYGDREALARALTGVLNDPERWQQLHARSVQAHEKYFSWERIAAEMVSALGRTR